MAPARPRSLMYRRPFADLLPMWLRDIFAPSPKEKTVIVPEAAFAKDMQALSVRPGDMLILKSTSIPSADLSRLAEALRDSYADTTVAIINDEVDIGVLRKVTAPD